MFPLRIQKTIKKYNSEPSPAVRKVSLKKQLSQIQKNLKTSVKGMSWFTSRIKTSQAPGSMTVEAAFVLPLFLFFFLHLAGVMEMLRLHGRLEAALWNVGNQMTLYTETFRDEGESLPDMAISYLLVHNRIAEFLGEDYLEKSPLVYGAGGLNYLRSEYMDAEECVDIVVTYQVEPVVSIFPFRYRRMNSRYYARCWTGYDVADTENAVRYVYVTSQGEVWHETPECSHIHHEVISAPVSQISEKKNIRGYGYTLCEFCEDEPRGKYVYFTKGGEKYHFLESCSAIYKDIRAVEWYEGLPYRACSRCVSRD